MNLRTISSPTFWRYALVGGINTALDFGILITLRQVGFDPLIANIISSTTAFVFSFFANKKYTFKTHGTDVRREMILFTVVTLCGLWIIQSIVIKLTLPLATHILWSNASYGLLGAKLLATFCSLVWNYLLYKKLVFIKH